jgi:hypothetical protein
MTSSSLMQSSFSLNFDETRVRQIFSRLCLLTELDRQNHPLFRGQGTHFQCFEVRSGQESLALKIAKQGFLLERRSTLKNWHQAIGSLRPHWHPLIPPMKLVTDKDFTAYVQPFGRTLTPGPIETGESIDSLLKTLSKHNLVLNGIIQMATWNDSLFVHDWSDLQADVTIKTH